MHNLSRALPIIAAAMLAACSSIPLVGGGDTDEASMTTGRSEAGRGMSGTREGASPGVNLYLWRSSLETINFMPLIEVDPFGGVIISDWYTNQNQPDERFKATVYILDQQLRADALRVTVHRQTRQGSDWVDAPTAEETEIQIENAILTRARQLRVSNLD